MTNTKLLCDLLAIMHRDGGHHTCEVGIEKSVRDAEEVFWQLSRERDEARTERDRLIQALRSVGEWRGGVDRGAVESLVTWAKRPSTQGVS